MTALEMRAIAKRDLKSEARANVLIDEVMFYSANYNLPTVPLFKQLLKIVVSLKATTASPDKLEELIRAIMSSVIQKAREISASKPTV